MAPWVTRISRALRPSGGRSAALTALDTAWMERDPPFGERASRGQDGGEGDTGGKC